MYIPPEGQKQGWTLSYLAPVLTQTRSRLHTQHGHSLARDFERGKKVYQKSRLHHISQQAIFCSSITRHRGQARLFVPPRYGFCRRRVRSAYVHTQRKLVHCLCKRRDSECCLSWSAAAAEQQACCAKLARESSSSNGGLLPGCARTTMAGHEGGGLGQPSSVPNLSGKIRRR